MGLAGLLLAVTLALFWPAQGYDYIHLDDIPYVVENPILAEGLTWTGVRQAFTTVWQQWWLPLLWLSYLADLAVFGAGPHGHHLVNILLHAANAVLLFWALVRLTGRRWPCFFAAALFAWHPTRVEAVAWITARKDVLSGLFFMLSLLAYSRHVRRPSAGRMAAVAGCMLAGLLSKAILIVLPPLLLVLDYWPLKRAQRLWGRKAWREWTPLLLEKTPLIVLAAVFMAINLRTHVSGTGAELALPAATRLGLIAPNVMAYLRILAVPVRLNVIYPDSNAVVWPVALGAAVLLLAVTLAGLGQRKKRPWLLAGWLWFLVGLLPILRGVRLGLAQYADRWTYLPLIGLGIALAWTAAEWSRGPRRRRMAGVLGAVVLGLCLIRTQGQLRWWRDSLTLLSRAVHLAPDAATAHFGLGNALFEKGRIEEAEGHFRETVRLYPGDEMHWANWGMALVLRGRAEEARRLLADHVRDSTDRTPLRHAAYGMACLHLGDRESAVRHLRRELEIRPAHQGYRVELIRALFEKGAEAEALNEAAMLTEWPGGDIRSAMDLFPFYLQRWQDGAQPYAWGFFRRLTEREPDNAALLNNMAWLAATDPGAPAEAAGEAVRLAQRAEQLDGGRDPAILNTLSAALAQAGDAAEALAAGKRALALARAQGNQALAERIRIRVDRMAGGGLDTAPDE